MSTPLRDQRIGKRLALTGGVRMLRQAHSGGSTHDNVLRMKDWRNRVATIPHEMRMRRDDPNVRQGYVPIPRCRSLVTISP
jgi:hypothetical protein